MPFLFALSTRSIATMVVVAFLIGGVLGFALARVVA